ncbi:hypothetical protein SAMN05660236_1100 [Ohtaekwangia koreensis]|uniref:DUF5723 domain-containing protein n=1 Tax=Ohtaekwangia koreensis TaxID=688867 RepID=A0A1T5JH07_9BACT|nr:hypothetical protein SAMN05660236_1100 [Ohtaekwangia koreensis]
MKSLLLTVFCIIAYSILNAQNLESIGKEKPLSITGGISLNQIVYGVRGIESRRDPYSYYASGNINFSLYGWSCPLSFSISNQNTSFQQPFNQYSLHPTYKWITAHAGYTSMTFSPYTVNGHIFLGGGIDLAPEGKFKFSALYGRFLKAVEPNSDTTLQNVATPAFKRMGYGFKASYGDGSNFVDVITFHAQDEVNSIQFVPEDQGILPEENLVMSIAAGKSLFEHFLVKAEISASALSRDTRAAEADQDHPLAKAKFIYTPRISSSYYKAFKTSLNYQQDGYALGVAYERIDPQYRTLGSYYFNNDLESITANGAVAILQGKMNVAVSAGTQRDNLDKTKISTMRRAVGSINIGYTPTQKVNLGVSYSNFQTYTNIRSQFIDVNQLTPYDNLDTLNYTQISQNATVTAMYMFGKNENKRQTLNCNLTFQDAADKQGEVTQNSGTQFYNVNTAYALSIVPQNMMVSVSLNAALNKGADVSSKTLGPTVAVSKTFFEKKLRTTLSSSYNNTYTNSERVSTVLNGRVNGSISVQKKHNLNLSLVVVNRSSNREGSAQEFTEFTGTLGYSYSFGLR